jgi:hypothetical protein
MSGIPAFFKATSIRDFATLKFKMYIIARVQAQGKNNGPASKARYFVKRAPFARQLSKKDQ